MTHKTLNKQIGFHFLERTYIPEEKQWYLDDSFVFYYFLIIHTVYIKGNHYLSENRTPAYKQYLKVMMAYFCPAPT